jgi:hypothetical protein
MGSRVAGQKRVSSRSFWPTDWSSASRLGRIINNLQRQETSPFNFVPLGEFTLQAGGSGFVEISDNRADGRVAIDGVRWVWLGEGK